MKAWKQKTWQRETTGLDGKCQLFSVNIFDYKWHNTGEKAHIKDPLYGQEYDCTIFCVTIDGQDHKFAAGEFSNCVWGFYVFKY